jgi:hypothetical protein
MSKRPPQEPTENLVLFSQEDLAVERIAFDEMNIVELPFSLLTRNTEGIYEVPLSADGSSTLACLKSSRYGLPNGLAPKVLLGLMWLWKTECDPSEQTFSVRLRYLIQRYMYPGRFDNYPPNSELQKSVEHQIHCIAGTRLHTNRWYVMSEKGKKDGGRKEVDINIVGDVILLEPGGRNRPRVLRVTWGREFWLSMVGGYTKPIDARIVQNLDSPLDLQLYRLLDRQLTTKKTQSYNDIIEFARFKIGMHGSTLDRGGRTASTYVATKLTQSINRLSRENFTVRLTIDSSVVPFKIRFDLIEPRIPDQPHEVVTQDFAMELVREFEFQAHGAPRDKKRTRIKDSHRQTAQEWVDKYGLEQAKWMVARCVRAQKESKSPPIQVFAGLQFYEASALGAYEKHQAEKAGQQRLAFENLEERLWERYQEALVVKFNDAAESAELKELEDMSLHNVRSKAPNLAEEFLKIPLAMEVKALKRERMKGLPREDFRECLRKHRGLTEQFKAELQHHHGFDPFLQPSSV